MVDDLIVISKNRAMQLHLMLESNKKNCDFFKNISVIYLASDEKFDQGYELLKSRWPAVKFIRETNFEEDIKHAVRSAGELVSMLCDDGIFYQDIKQWKDTVVEFSKREEIFTFILGLGENCFVDVLGRTFAQPEFHKPQFYRDEGVLVWNWRHAAPGEFACPMMFAGNIYKKKDYLPCVEAINFAAPSPFEINLQDTYHRPGSSIKDLCACLKTHAILHSTNNRVSTYGNMPHGAKYFYSDVQLNDSYLSGKIVDYKKIDFGNVISIHTELELPLKEING